MDIDLTYTPFSDGVCWWRTMTAGQFLDDAELPEEVLCQIRRLVSKTSPATDLRIIAAGQLRMIMEDLSLAPNTFNLEQGLPDKLLHCWLEVQRIMDLMVNMDKPTRAQQLLPVLHGLLDDDDDVVPGLESNHAVSVAKAELAFNQVERRFRDNDYPSARLLGDIQDRYNKYLDNPQEYLAPYSALVGPSGIGKSYSVKQLALRHGVYVLYFNLGPDSMGFPRQSSLGLPHVAQNIDERSHNDRWTRFLEFCLVVFRCCGQQNINPAGLFALMVHKTHGEFGRDLQRVFDEPEKDMEEQVSGVVTHHRLDLLAHENQPPITPADRPGFPFLICFDEAESLFVGTRQENFHALRSAARQLFDKKDKNIFLLLLGTTSKITNFAPPQRFDTPQVMRDVRLLPPLWKIDSWAIFAPARMPDPDGQPGSVSQLFGLGRPLWGALLASGVSLEDVIALARHKMNKPRRNRGLALLCTRVNYYIGRFSLAEDLIAHHLRFVVSIEEDTDTLISSQPSEPMLAFVSCLLLQDQETRLGALRSWAAALAEGSVNPGDVGEQIAALILLFAFDDASAKPMTLPKPISLRGFWTSLFGPEKTWGHRDDVSPDTSIFVNHFIRVSAIPTREVIEEAYCRGAGLILPSAFAGIDLLIPMKSPTSEMGAILVQVKNRIDDSITPGLKNSFRDAISAGIGALGLERPLAGGYLGLAMCLRRKQGSRDYDIVTPTATRQTQRRGKFEVVIALGLDVYGWTRHWPNADSAKSIFQWILKSWPQLYHDEVVNDTYSSRLIYPFQDLQTTG